VLDLGTGSGILAIAAVKLRSGRGPAVDIDGEACEIARANAVANGTGDRIRVADRLEDAEGPFDLIVANLFAEQLVDFAPRLARLLRPGGVVIGAGILEREVTAVLAAWTAAVLNPRTPRRTRTAGQPSSRAGPPDRGTRGTVRGRKDPSTGAPPPATRRDSSTSARSEPGATVRLDRDETKHARVRRLHRGEAVALFDGAGNSWRGRFEGFDGESALVGVGEAAPRGSGESPLSLTLAIALLKADKLDWVVEKAAELWRDPCRPFRSRHGLAEPSAARRESEEDCPQRGQAERALRAAARRRGPDVRRDLGSAGRPAPVFLGRKRRKARRRGAGALVVVAIVGPEARFLRGRGGVGRQGGRTPGRPRPRILRAETAALAAVALCQHSGATVTRTKSRAHSRESRARSRGCLPRDGSLGRQLSTVDSLSTLDCRPRTANGFGPCASLS